MSNPKLQTGKNSESSYIYDLLVGGPHPQWGTWHPAITQDGAIYHYTVLGHEVTWFLNSPGKAAVNAFHSGPCELGLPSGGQMQGLLFRFGRASVWNVAPRMDHMVHPKRRAPMPNGDNEGARLLITLVDRTTGKVLGLRMLTWPPAFTQAANQALRTPASPPSKVRAPNAPAAGPQAHPRRRSTAAMVSAAPLTASAEAWSSTDTGQAALGPSRKVRRRGGKTRRNRRTARTRKVVHRHSR